MTDLKTQWKVRNYRTIYLLFIKYLRERNNTQLNVMTLAIGLRQTFVPVVKHTAQKLRRARCAVATKHPYQEQLCKCNEESSKALTSVTPPHKERKDPMRNILWISFISSCIGCKRTEWEEQPTTHPHHPWRLATARSLLSPHLLYPTILLLRVTSPLESCKEESLCLRGDMEKEDCDGRLAHSPDETSQTNLQRVFHSLISSISLCLPSEEISSAEKSCRAVSWVHCFTRAISLWTKTVTALEVGQDSELPYLTHIKPEIYTYFKPPSLLSVLP